MPGRLARLESVIRRITLWPSQEDIDRWDREDRKANTVWFKGKPVLVRGFMRFGDRADDYGYGDEVYGDDEDGNRI